MRNETKFLQEKEIISYMPVEKVKFVAKKVCASRCSDDKHMYMCMVYKRICIYVHVIKAMP